MMIIDNIEQLRFAITTKKNIRKTMIIKEIDKMISDEDNKSYFTRIEEGTVLFRARIIEEFKESKQQGVNVDDNFVTTGFSEGYSKEPPLGKAPSGRNNIEGASYLYTADSIETACAEVKAIPQDVISIAEFIVKKPLRLLNLSINRSTINMDDKEKAVIIDIANQYRNPVKSEKEYRVSQVISDYVNKAGIDGLIYSSFYTNGNNITLFRSHPSIISFKESRLLLYKGAVHIFWDFNNKSKLVAERMNQMEYDCTEAKQILEQIKSKLNPPKVYFPNCYDDLD